MRKLLTVAASMLLIAGVFSTQAIGHGGSRGDNGKHFGWHHGAKGWRADLKAPGSTAPTGPTAGVARHGHRGKGYGATGPTGAETTGPVGKFVYGQNHKRYVWGVKLKGLTASTAYTVAVAANPNATAKSKKARGAKYGSTGATGPTSWTGAGGLPATITTDANGAVVAAGKGLRADFSLNKKTAYIVTVTDASGVVVLQGALLRKTHRAHRGCDGYSRTGSSSRKRHSHR